jgi:hypothetical protein
MLNLVLNLVFEVHLRFERGKGGVTFVQSYFCNDSAQLWSLGTKKDQLKNIKFIAVPNSYILYDYK